MKLWTKAIWPEWPAGGNHIGKATWAGDSSCPEKKGLISLSGRKFIQSLFACSSCRHSKKGMPVIALPALCLAMSYLWLHKLFWARPSRMVQRSQGIWCKLQTSTCTWHVRPPGIRGGWASVAQAASAETNQQQVVSTSFVAGTTLQ